MKSRLLLTCVVAFSALNLCAETSLDIPPLQQAPNDETAYRRFTLDNSIKVLLVSDPKLNKSSASLAVGVGSISDPKDRQGLAHFLEHMLFLGTEKYPDESDYSNYLRSNGGYNNAYTAEDHTNYHFEIRHEALEGALDRFSQFFIAPLFSPTFTEREMNAVNSEAQFRLENDDWREFQLNCSISNADHPANHYNIGNKETLTGTTREELMAFYKKYYSANQMTLSVVSKASLDQLESWVRTYFSPVIDHKFETLRFDPEYLSRKAALRLIQMEPLKDVRQLGLVFTLPGTRDFWTSKPSELIGYILGYEGEGSLLSQLKAEGLATGLSAGGEARTEDFGWFNINIKLTPAGLEQHPHVMNLVFAAINQLRTSDYPSYLFNERRAMARLDEMFKDKGEGAGRATEMANRLRDYPFDIAERGPYLWLKEDPEAYKMVLDQLRPDNLMATLMAKGLTTDKVEHYYGTKYSYTEDAGEAYTALLNPAPVASIQLPKANPFIPTEAALRPYQPVTLISEPGLDLYFAQDTEFERPMVAEIYRFRLPRSMASLENSVLLKFYETCVNEVLNETAYAAQQAGLNFGFSADLEGVKMSLSGYDESATRLRDKIAANLINFELSAERFAALKDRLVQGYASFPRLDAYKIISQTRRTVVREFYYRPDEQLPVAQEVTLADVQKFARQLYAKGKIQALVYGNVTAVDAVAAARRFSSVLKVSGVAAEDLLSRNLLQMKPGESVRTNEKLVGNNSVYWREYVIGDDTPELRAATLALSNFMAEPYYTEMRTHQQLGYIVWGGADIEEHTTYAYFIIQSGEHLADEMEGKSEAFIATLPDLLAGMPDEAWNTIKGGVRAKLLENDKTVAERASRFFELGYNKDADWGRQEETLKALEALTKARAGEILSQTLAESSRRERTYLGFARQHEPAAPPVTTFTDRSDWKKTRSYK